MSLYAIGDLHLHFETPLKAQAQRKERVWKNHEEKLVGGRPGGLLYVMADGVQRRGELSV